MVEINLMPWRVYSYEYTKRKIIRCSIIVFLITFFLAAMCFIIEYQVKMENHVVIQLKKELEAAEKMHDMHNASSVTNSHPMFHHSQTKLFYFFNELIHLTTDDIIFQNMISQNENIILSGYATSFESIMQLLNQCNKTENACRAELLEIKGLPHSEMLQFSMQFLHVISPLFHSIKINHD